MKSPKIEPKASTIYPETQPVPAQGSAPKAQAVGDSFTQKAADHYQGLVNGKAECIEGGVISEMYYASRDGTRVRPDAYEAIQDILRGIMDMDTREIPPTDTIGDIPYVPDLDKDILKGKTAFEYQHFEPVVERYAALEKTLVAMANVAQMNLEPDKMCQMSTDEIRYLKAYAKKIEEALFNCRSELRLAKQYHTQELLAAQEAAAAEAAKGDAVDEDLESI